VTMWEYLFRWETLWWALIALYIPTCLGLIAIVLLQKGKGVGFAGAFGMGGGSEAVFGPRGNVNFPVRLTYTLATLFMILSLSMSLVAGRLGMGIAPEEVDPAAQAQVEGEEFEGEGFGGFDIEDMDDPDAPMEMPDADAPMEMPDADAPMEMPDAEDLEFTDPEADPEGDMEMEPEIEFTPAPEDEAEDVEPEDITEPEEDVEPEDEVEPDDAEPDDDEDGEADEDGDGADNAEEEAEEQ